MGLLDFFRRSAKPQLSSDELRDQLFAAVALNDAAKANHLFSAHTAQIAAEIRNWMKCPQDIREKKPEIEIYIRMISWLMESLERAGHKELVKEITAPSPDDPMGKWQRGLDEASKLNEHLRYDEAMELLNNLLIDNRGLIGSAADHFVALTHGALGHDYFASGKVLIAKGHYEHALRLCTGSAADAEGILVYTNLLYETHRYLGESVAAADYALRSAELNAQAGREDQVHYMRSQAEIVRAGEPLLRMVMSLDGATYEIEAAPRIPERKEATFIFARNRTTLRLCARLTELAVEHAQANRIDEAMEHFRQASTIDPYDPDAHNKAGLALLAAQRYPQAIEEYEQVEQLAPGWFNSRSDLWIAQQLAIGRLTHENFVALWALEDGKTSDQEKLRLANAMIRGGTIPLAHLLLGQVLCRLDRNPEAAEAYKAGLALDPEPDVRSRLKAQLAAITDDRALKLKLIEEAQDPAGNLMAATLARILLRQNA